jgi:hypothetical protein
LIEVAAWEGDGEDDYAGARSWSLGWPLYLILCPEIAALVAGARAGLA